MIAEGGCVIEPTRSWPFGDRVPPVNRPFACYCVGDGMGNPCVNCPVRGPYPAAPPLDPDRERRESEEVKKLVDQLQRGMLESRIKQLEAELHRLRQELAACP